MVNLAPNSRLQSIIVGTSRQQELKADGHITPIVWNRPKWMHGCSLKSSAQLSLSDTTQESMQRQWCHLHTGLGLPIPIGLIKKILYTHARRPTPCKQSLFEVLIPSDYECVRLTVNAKDHRGHLREAVTQARIMVQPEVAIEEGNQTNLSLSPFLLFSLISTDFH